MMEMHNDITRIMFTAEHLKARVEEIGAEISRDYEGRELLAVGILKGATVFFADLVRAIKVPVQFDFMIASSYGNQANTTGTVKILKDLDVDIAGKHVIVIEDIIDSGLTMNYMMKLLADRQPASLKLCALLSKPSRRRSDVTISYLGAEVPDEFLVGYGLDYAGRYRNLPYIGILRPTVYRYGH